MFDLVFDAFSAWNQMGLIIMALAFLSIGGGLIAYELYWRILSIKIKGRISAVRVSHTKTDQEEPETKVEEKDLDLVEELKSNPIGTSLGGLVILLFLGLPMLFSGIGIYMGYSYISLTKTGEYANARVIRNDSSYDSDSGTSYKAVLVFNDKSGRRWEVKDNISYGNSPSYSTGTNIGVYYQRNDPNEFVIDDFWHNMGISIAFTCFGFIFIGFIVFASFLNNRKSEKPHKSDKKQSFVGEMYYSVFEYKAPNGRRYEKISDMGSNSLVSRIPGTPVDLMVFPNNYEKVRRPMFVWLIFGIVFFLPGIFIMNIAMSSFEFNYVMLLLILSVIGFIFYKMRSVIGKVNKVDMALVKDAWEDLKENGVTVSSSNGSASKGRILSKEEILVRLKKQVAYSRISAYAMMVVSMGLLFGSYVAGNSMIEYMTDGIHARGEVVSIESKYNSSSEGSRYTYYSVVKFSDLNGNYTRFQDSVGSSHPAHNQGDEVDVLYIAGNLENAMIDRGIFNWSLSSGLALGALFILWGSMYNFKVSNRFGDSKYRRRV